MSTKQKRLYFAFLSLAWIVLLANVYYQYGDVLFSSYTNKSSPVTIIEFQCAVNATALDQEGGSFYWDTGKGFSQKQVVSFYYHDNGDGISGDYRVVLPEKKPIKALRFDPLQSKGVVKINYMKIHKYISRDVDFSKHTVDTTTMHAIESIVSDNGGLTITTNGGDPYFIIFDDFKKYQKR